MDFAGNYVSMCAYNHCFYHEIKSSIWSKLDSADKWMSIFLNKTNLTNTCFSRVLYVEPESVAQRSNALTAIIYVFFL